MRPVNLVGLVCWFRYTRLALIIVVTSLREFYEAYLPAEPSQAGQDPRFPEAHEHHRWSQDHRLAPASGAQAAGRLTLSRRRSISLTVSPEFERVYRKGSVYRGRLFSVHLLPNTLCSPRLGLSVSRKVGGAVNRNKVRRRLKEIFRSSVMSLPGGADFVISARPPAAEASFEELNDEFLRSLRRLGKSTGSGEARDAS